MDRLQALLNGRTPKLKDPVSVDKVNHATERARLNNEDRKYNQIVFDNEVKQANLYNQSVMPNTGKDIGVGFKINVYIIKLTQLLGYKGELEKALLNYFASGVSIQKLRGTTKEAQIATDFFKKGEILATFNELMLYVKTYANDIINDDSFRSQIYNSSFNPLIQLLNDTSALYPAFFGLIPKPSNAGQPTENASERKIYETAREQSIGCYSLFNTMTEFLNNGIFRPITKEDVAKYIKDNNVREIFSRNRVATDPLIAPIPAPLFPINPPQPPPPPPERIPEPFPNPQQGQQGQPAPAPPQPAPQAPAFNPADDAYITQLVEAKQAIEARYLFVKSSQDVADIIAEVRQANPQMTPQEERTLSSNLKNKIKELRGQAGLAVGSQESQANIAEATRVYQGQQQGQQGGPAPVIPPAQQPQGVSLRSIGEQEAPITETGSVWTAMDGDDTYGQGGAGMTQMELVDLRAVVRDSIEVIKRLEDTKGRILRQKDRADVEEALQSQAQATTTNLNRLIPDEQDRRDFMGSVIDGMKDVRIRYRDIKAQDDNRPDYIRNKDERTLYGLGRERNNDLIHNAVLDFENMARRQAREGDKDTIMELSPELKGLEPKLRFHINQMRRDRMNEPNMWGKGKHEYKQGIIKRAGQMSIMDEFDPKAEAFKRGKVMSGGCDTCNLRGGMGNQEWSYSGYGEIANEEDTPFRRMLGGMPNPFAPKNPPETPRPLLPFNASFEEDDDKDYYDEILPEEGSHYAELEKPVDLDDFADSIRKNNENYKVATGKMKSVKYRN